MSFRYLACIAATLIFLSSCSGDPRVPPLQTVDSVDLGRYVGLWHEIASYPTFFNRNCTATTAEYIPQGDGTIQVVNECNIGSPTGRVNRIDGTARVVNPVTNAELEVTFFLFGRGDYWIIDLDEDYQWAVVGDPGRTTLFILSRTRTLDEEILDGIEERLLDNCYDPSFLEMTFQP